MDLQSHGVREEIQLGCPLDIYVFMVKKCCLMNMHMCMQIRTAIIEKPNFFNIWKTVHDNIMKMVSTHVSMVKDDHNVT